MLIIHKDTTNRYIECFGKRLDVCRIQLNDVIVGYINYQPKKIEGGPMYADVMVIELNKMFQGRGVGTMVIKLLLSSFSHITCCVAEPKALTFWNKFNPIVFVDTLPERIEEYKSTRLENELEEPVFLIIGKDTKYTEELFTHNKFKKQNANNTNINQS